MTDTPATNLQPFTVTQTIQGGKSSTVALTGSTEEEQFQSERVAA